MDNLICGQCYAQVKEWYTRVVKPVEKHTADDKKWLALFKWKHTTTPEKKHEAYQKGDNDPKYHSNTSYKTTRITGAAGAINQDLVTILVMRVILKSSWIMICAKMWP